MKLQYRPLSDQAVEALNEYIASNGIKPGEALPGEEALAELFGVSRPVVREALRKLAGMGVVEIAKGKGALVRPITSDPLRFYFDRAVKLERQTIVELMEIRMGLEIEGVRLAAERRDDADIATLREIVSEMRHEIGRADRYTEVDVRLHLALAAASKNEMLYHLVESIEDALRQTISEGLRDRRTPDELEHVQRLHERIVSEVAAGRPEATRAMRAHFDEAIRVLTQSLQTQHVRGARPNGDPPA